MSGPLWMPRSQEWFSKMQEKTEQVSKASDCRRALRSGFFARRKQLPVANSTKLPEVNECDEL